MRRLVFVATVLLAIPAWAKPDHWPIFRVPNCKPICERLLSCKAGPWKTLQDCVDACEPTNEDSPKVRSDHGDIRTTGMRAMQTLEAGFGNVRVEKACELRVEKTQPGRLELVNFDGSLTLRAKIFGGSADRFWFQTIACTRCPPVEDRP
jgi:hypothetical protein